MKAVIITPVYPLNQTEKEDYVNIPANILSGMGLEVEILTLAKGEEITRPFKVKRFGNTLSLLLYCLRTRPRIMHTFLRPYAPSLFAGLLPFKKVHIVMSDIIGSNKLVRMLSIFLLKGYDKVLTHTPYGEELFSDLLSKNKVMKLPLPVDFELFGGAKSAKALRKLKLDRGDFVITCVANFRSIKGVDVLIKAFAIAKKNIKNAKLVLVGKDYLAEEGKPTIKEMTQDKDVIHVGFLEGKDIKDVLDITDVFCMASSIDAQCISIYEAAADSIPMCLSNLPSFTSVFEKFALYHPVGDAEKLANDIIKYHKDPQLRKRNGKGTKELANFASYRLVKKQLEELYKSLLTRS